MKILLDANFIRNLQSIRRIGLISGFVKQNNSEFNIPAKVIEELEKKNIPKEIQNLIDREIISIAQCTETNYKQLSMRFLGLGEGELEAICLVSICLDNTFKDYVIMTDDDEAQKMAASMGINSLSIVSFLLMANHVGLLNSKEALESLDKLDKGIFTIESAVRTEFTSHLI